MRYQKLLTQKLTALEAEQARLIELHDRAVKAAQQAQLAGVQIEAQIALLKELLANG